MLICSEQLYTVDRISEGRWRREELGGQTPELQSVSCNACNELLISFIHSSWHYSPLLGPGLFISFAILFTLSGGLLERGISPSQGRYLHTEQHKHRINSHTDTHALSWIRTHDPSARASGDSSCLKPHGPCDWQWIHYSIFSDFFYLSIYLSIYLSMALQSFCWTLSDFSASSSFTQSVELLGRGSARRKAATYTQDNTNTE
jgi:hypothetical protein